MADTIAELQQQIESLTNLLQREKEKNRLLEEECDLLASENERLREKSNSAKDEKVIVEDLSKISVEEVFSEGNNDFAKVAKNRIENCCGTQNSLCIAYLHSEYKNCDILVCGGVDKVIRCYDNGKSDIIFKYVTKSPILAISACQSVIAFSLMDGSHIILDVDTFLRHSFTEVNHTSEHIDDSDSSSPITSSCGGELVFHDHQKYVTNIMWSLDGQYLATISYDKSANLYKRERSGANLHVTLVKSFRFETTPESLAFATASRDVISDAWCFENSTSPTLNQVNQVIFGCRDVSYLMYVNCETLVSQKVSLNVNEWDTHVSFTPLYLSVSNNNKYICVCTNNSLHLVLLRGTNKRLKVLSSHTCNEYGKPKVMWDQSDCYLYSNDQNESVIFVYEVGRGVVAEVLRSHRGVVKDLKRHPDRQEMVSIGNDKAIIVWV